MTNEDIKVATERVMQVEYIQFRGTANVKQLLAFTERAIFEKYVDGADSRIGDMQWVLPVEEEGNKIIFEGFYVVKNHEEDLFVLSPEEFKERYNTEPQLPNCSTEYLQYRATSGRRDVVLFTKGEAFVDNGSDSCPARLVLRSQGEYKIISKGYYVCKNHKGFFILSPAEFKKRYPSAGSK